jgi:branched-chain amino acid transport system substrate-binding protein
MKRNNFPPSLVATLAVAMLAASIPATAAQLSGRSVKIGAMYPLTGKGAEWGEAAKVGINLAAEEINAAGGIGGVPIKLIEYDYQAKESEGINIINKLTTRDDVMAVLGPCFSSVVEVIYPLLERLKTPVISYCSAKPGLGKLSEWGFRNSLTSDKQLAPVVTAWKDAYDIKTVVIIHDLEDAVSKAEGSKVLPMLFKKEDIEVLETLTYRTEDTDFSAQITKAKSLNPDGIGLGSCYQQAAGIVKEARRQGMKQPVIGGACAGAPGYVTLGGKATEGTYVSTAAWMDDPSARVQDFVKKVHAKNGGKQFPYSAPRGYDTLYITKMCMEKFGVTNKSGDLASDRDKIRRCWSELKNYPGVSGDTTMNEVGDGSGGIRVLKVSNGKYVDVSQ